MFNRFITITSITGALIGLGFYFASAAPSINAAGDDFLLTWSCNSYLPPNYEGKALPTQGSQIKVVVLPTKKIVYDPDKLIYRWFLDDESTGSASGRGKSSFIFPATKIAGASHQIESQILDGNEKLLSRKFLTLKIFSPEILISDSQNYFLPRTILASTGQEFSLRSVPLFFNVKKLQELNFNWEADGRILSSAFQPNPSEITVKIPAGKILEKIIKTFSVRAVEKKNEFQQIQTEITLKIK